MKLAERLTDKTARALQLAVGKDSDVWWDADLGGFGIRVRDTGARSWIVQYDLDRSYKMTLGSIETWTAARARAAAKDILARVRLGQNPAAEKRAARDEVGETFGAWLPRYLAFKRGKLRPRSIEEVERHLLTHLRPLHRRSIRGIDRRAVAMVRAGIAERSGPVVSDNVGSSGSGFYTWLMREGLAEENPFINGNKASTANPRDRTPNDSELRDIWRACPDTDYGRIIKLLALTGARRTEISSLAWCEIDFDQALITLPAQRVKGKRAHEIPLSTPALAILQAQPRRAGRDFVFGSSTHGFRGYARAKRDLDARINASRRLQGKPPMPRWVVHDLRRSFSTTAHGQLKIVPHVIEACLGHLFGSTVSRTYNKADYRDEKRRALDLWAAHLMVVVA
jgi:integrase